ncbi:hypothetical protein EJP69_14195 [Variovorax gossypii]|uniref:NERD domain-containing protein n=1 Tax=Variovorax gossypii TaxID=1679495 RepID=A0A431TPP4_9BURK|nr:MULTISPECIES: hypothetical protein [Variovorax]MDR6522194.1 hypothetical protein [Variovorax paradoxus]RTQ35508.1 hypothetical protein EJP69_14195 [Variovorax gossypii]
MPDLVETTLKNIGPCVSTTLVAALIKEHGLSAVNARQKVSRATSIKKLAHILFPHRARFVYLQSDYGSPEFWHALTHELLANSVSYGGGLAALMARGGAMPVGHFTIACGAPVAQRGHLSPAGILERLKAAQLVRTVDEPGIGECVELSHQSASDAFELARMRARLYTEQVLLGAVKDWARNLGMVSYNKVELRDENDRQPKVGTFHWDLAGPSYLGPLAKRVPRAKPKPGFLVCDVLLGVNVSADELRPFINKCTTLRSLTKVGACLQVFVADGYTPEAYALAREQGVMSATTASLFGLEVAKALRELAELLREVFPRAGTFEKIDAVFAQLSHIEGAANNLRGALFEYLVAEIVRTTSPHTSIQVNEVFRADGSSAEVDVLVEHRDHAIRFIECKGYRPGGTVPDEMIERWLRDRIPLLRKAAAANTFWHKCRFEFEFWTSGTLTPEAEALIAAAAERTKKYGIKLVSARDLVEIGQATNNSPLKNTLQEHFLGHPLEKAERTAQSKQRRLAIPPSSKLAKRSGEVAANEFFAED